MKSGQRPLSVMTQLTQLTAVDNADLIGTRKARKRSREELTNQLKKLFTDLPSAKDDYELVTRIDVKADKQIEELDEYVTLPLPLPPLLLPLFSIL